MGVRTIALMSALALSAPAVVEAQWGSPWSQTAYNTGYERGTRAGENDSRRGETFNYTDESDYRSADAGYRREYGDRNRYRDEFRRGYQSGYRDAYDQSGYRRPGQGFPVPRRDDRDDDGRYDPRYDPRSDPRSDPRYDPRNDRRNDVAAATGYNDGYDAGLRDGRDRRRSDPYSEGRYRSGDHGYRNQYGHREIYRRNYRDAFIQGYQRGHNDGRRYNGSSNSSRPGGLSRPWWWPF